MKRKLLILSLFLLIITNILVGCGTSKVKSIEKADKDVMEKVADREKDKNEKDEKDEEDIVLYKIGEKVVIDEKYAITILGATEIEDRNLFADEEVAQVVIIDYLYENIGEETKDIYISDINFKSIDEGGNPIKVYPIGQIYPPEYTPIGGRTLTSMSVATLVESEKIRLRYVDNMFESKGLVEFEIEIGTSAEFKLEGEEPIYDNLYGIGDIIEIKTEEGSYALTINSIDIINDRNEFSEKNPKDVYKIGYTYSNINMEEDLYIAEIDFRVLDGNGVMGFSYPGATTERAKPVVKGEKITAELIFGTHTKTNTLILCYRDNLFSETSDFKIKLNYIENQN